ncbi:unnamed protein product [Sphagnum balticum]
MEFTVRANEDGDEEEKVAAAGGEYRVSTSAGRESSNLTLKEGEGLYKLTRHKSAVFEHDFRHYANSLNRTSSEVRALPLQLGLQAHDQKDCRKDVFGIGGTEALAVTVESQKSDNKELLSHSPSLKIGQLEKFVYKNYSLHGRRTASLPVGKEHAHKLHSGQSSKGQGFPFNAIVLGLGHMRATGEGFDTLGLGDKMDLIQMMLDCAETMTSVLDNVTDMGNFLSNAMTFMPAGGKLDLDLQCEEVTEMPQGMITNGKVARIQFSVKDNGIVISAEDQVKLFEPYSFVTSGWVQKAGVSGLGLSMAKRYVEAVGGTIGVESTEGEGSTFFFSVPFPLVPFDPSIHCAHSQLYSESSLALLENAELSSSLSSSAVTQEPTTNWQLSIGRENPNTRNKEKVIDVVTVDSANFQRKVLLVEDTRINRIILRKVLQNLNLQCDEAENGQVAVDYYKQGKSYDLVLMDKEMPVMDGHEATRQLRLMGVKTPIIALTGNALQSDRDLFFEAGVDDFQTKPLSRDKLVQLLQKLSNNA